MGDYADDACNQDMSQWLSDGCSQTDIIPSRKEEGDPCIKAKCSGHYIKRQNKSNGNYFLGCSNFPKCRETYNLLNRR